MIKSLDLTIETGHFCIFGPNGCGKTTLLMMAAGLESIDEGEININGNKPCELKTKYLIGISSDKIELPKFLTAKQVLDFHSAQFGCEIEKALLDGLNFNKQLHQKVSDLSLGNQKKLSLLLAMIHKPVMLLLDEPTVGLDEKSKTWLLDYLEKFQGTVVVTSHEAVFMEDKNYAKLSMLELNT